MRFDLRRVSDSLYQSLNPSGGPVSSLVRVATEGNCPKPAEGKTVFVPIDGGAPFCPD